jgi:dienelactone hydrolase
VSLNTGLIRKTGKIPVLLAGADHDTIMPGDANALELSAWQENCRCDVSQFVLTDTGHAFMAHRSLPNGPRTSTPGCAHTPSEEDHS